MKRTESTEGFTDDASSAASETGLKIKISIDYKIYIIYIMCLRL